MATDTQPTVARYAALIFIDGAKLRLLRQVSGMNQTQLAELTGLSSSYIGHLERGTRRSCSPAAFNRLCRELHVQNRTELLDDTAPSEASQ